MPTDTALLLEKKRATDDAVGFVAGLELSAFAASRRHRNAVIRSPEVIGAAGGRISLGSRDNHPELPWRDNTRMRHRPILGYADMWLAAVGEVGAQPIISTYYSPDPTDPDTMRGTAISR